LDFQNKVEIMKRVTQQRRKDMDKIEMKCLEGYCHGEYYGARHKDGTYILPKLYSDFIFRV